MSSVLFSTKRLAETTVMALVVVLIQHPVINDWVVSGTDRRIK